MESASVEPDATTLSLFDSMALLFQPLHADLQAHVFSFLTEAELWLFHERCPEAVRQTLSHKSGIHFSFLHRILPNASATPDRNRQQMAVQKMVALCEEGTTNLKYLECDSLRGVTGQDWLMRLPSSLHTLNLTGCAGLEPDALIRCLEQPTRLLKSLNLTDCSKISNSVITAIANHQTQLEELWLGGCSQSITNGPLHLLLQNLTRITHLDLRGLNNLTDLSGQFVSILPSTLKSLNLTGCRQLRLASLEALEGIQYHLNHEGRTDLEHWNLAPISRFSNIMHLVLDSIGTPRVGLCRGIVTYFAMGRALREVHLTGCEHVQDWEVEALAVTCAETLTCFQMRAGPIGDPAVIALAKHCHLLAEVDLTSCFRVTDEGVKALTEPRHRSIFNSSDEDSLHHQPQQEEQQHQPQQEQQQDNKRTRRESGLRVLRLARLSHLTDEGVRSIARVKSLHVLDVRDCVDVSMWALVDTTMLLPRLIEVNATNIQEIRTSYLCQMRAMAAQEMPGFPVGLCLVNGRYQTWDDPKLDTKPFGCCSVRSQGQRLDGSTPKAVMYHCIDCNLVPSVDRGICASCISKCHRGHNTFVGEWARFYCDCAFGCAGNECEAIFPSPQAVPAATTTTAGAFEGSGEKNTGTVTVDS